MTGIFPKEFGRYLSKAFDKRSKGDYDIYANIDKELALNLLENAILFNSTLKKYLFDKGFLD